MDEMLVEIVNSVFLYTVLVLRAGAVERRCPCVVIGERTVLRVLKARRGWGESVVNRKIVFVILTCGFGILVVIVRLDGCG